MLKQTKAGLRVLLVFTVICGIIYPLSVWAVSRIPGLESRAEGSVVTAGGQAAGSSLIGIDPVAPDPAHDPYFHTRPSATASDPMGQGDPSTSGASNKGGFNQDLVSAIQQRKDAIARVARNTGLPDDTVRRLVEQHTTGYGIGIPGVNVLELNLAVAAAGAH